MKKNQRKKKNIQIEAEKLNVEKIKELISEYKNKKRQTKKRINLSKEK